MILLPFLLFFVKGEIMRFTLYITLEGPLCMMVNFLDVGSDCFFIGMFTDSMIVREIPNYPTEETNRFTIDGFEIRTGLQVADIVLAGDSSITFENFPYYHRIQDEANYTYNYFPMAYKFKDNSASVMHRLFQYKKTSEIGFGVSYLKNELIIGGVPQDITENKYRYNYTVNVDTRYTTWGCQLDSVQFGDDKMNFKKYTRFEVGKRSFYVPKDVMYKIKEVFLDKYNLCDDFIVEKKIFVDRSKIDNLPNINITIEGITFPLTTEEYFDCNDRRSSGCKFLFRYKTAVGDEYVIGDYFLSKYFVYFNQTGNSLTFFSEKELEVIREGNEAIKILVIALMATLIIGSGLLLALLFVNYSSKINELIPYTKLMK